MRIMSNNRILPAEDIHKYFVLDGSRLLRKFVDGSVRQLVSRDGSKIVCMYQGVRLLGVDIAWCLIHGNWPIWPIVQISEDLLNFARENLYPARLRQLRYRCIQRGSLYYHPLSEHPSRTPEGARKLWEIAARDFYVQDLQYVYAQEAIERDLRAAYVRDMAEANQRTRKEPEKRVKALPMARPKRPRAEAGREWHYNAGEWISVPVACHVADDYMRRIEAVRACAVRFEFQPAYSEVFAYMPDGSVYQR